MAGGGDSGGWDNWGDFNPDEVGGGEASIPVGTTGGGSDEVDPGLTPDPGSIVDENPIGYTDTGTPIYSVTGTGITAPSIESLNDNNDGSYTDIYGNTWLKDDQGNLTRFVQPIGSVNPVGLAPVPVGSTNPSVLTGQPANNQPPVPTPKSGGSGGSSGGGSGGGTGGGSAGGGSQPQQPKPTTGTPTSTPASALAGASTSLLLVFALVVLAIIGRKK